MAKVHFITTLMMLQGFFFLYGETQTTTVASSASVTEGSTPASSGQATPSMEGTTATGGNTATTSMAGGTVSTATGGGAVTTSMAGGTVSTAMGGNTVTTSVAGGTVTTSTGGNTVTTAAGGGGGGTTITTSMGGGNGGTVTTAAGGGGAATTAVGGGASGTVTTAAGGGGAATTAVGGGGGGTVTTAAAGGGAATTAAGGGGGGTVTTAAAGGGATVTTASGGAGAGASVTTASGGAGAGASVTTASGGGGGGVNSTAAVAGSATTGGAATTVAGGGGISSSPTTAVTSTSAAPDNRTPGPIVTLVIRVTINCTGRLTALNESLQKDIKAVYNEEVFPIKSVITQSISCDSSLNATLQLSFYTGIPSGKFIKVVFQAGLKGAKITYLTESNTIYTIAFVGVTFDYKLKAGECQKVCCNGGAGPVTFERSCTPSERCEGIERDEKQENGHCTTTCKDACDEEGSGGIHNSPSYVLVTLLAIATFTKTIFF